MIAGREPEHTFEQVVRFTEALEKKYGRDVAERIIARAKAAVSELVGGEPARLLTQAGRDPWPVVEADMFAEGLVKELRQAVRSAQGAIGRCDPTQRSKRAPRPGDCAAGTAYPSAGGTAKAASAARAAPAPQTQEMQHAEVPRHGDAGTDAIGAAFLSRHGNLMAIYRPGELTTRDGVLWHCNEPTRDKPGTSKSWTMMHKNLTKADR